MEPYNDPYSQTIKLASQLAEIFGPLLKIPSKKLGEWIGQKIQYAIDQNTLVYESNLRELRMQLGDKQLKEISTKSAVRLIEGAVTEDDPGLQAMWARLTMAHADPDTADRTHPVFIGMLEDMAPSDARLLAEIARAVRKRGYMFDSINKYQLKLGLYPNVEEFPAELQASLANLARLGIINETPPTNRFRVPFSRRVASEDVVTVDRRSAEAIEDLFDFVSRGSDFIMLTVLGQTLIELVIPVEAQRGPP